MSPTVAQLKKREEAKQDSDPLWTVNEVAEYLRWDPETIRQKARLGVLPGLKMGRVWRFRSQAIKTWVAQVEDSGKVKIKTEYLVK